MTRISLKFPCSAFARDFGEFLSFLSFVSGVVWWLKQGRGKGARRKWLPAGMAAGRQAVDGGRATGQRWNQCSVRPKFLAGRQDVGFGSGQFEITNCRMLRPKNLECAQ